MRLACASRAFDRAFACGDLTQLEFVDACARVLACDGVVLDAQHFPRFDEDYLAQVKKMTTDLGLTIAAYADGSFFLANADGMARGIERALLLGAPLLAAPLGKETQLSWSAHLTRLNGAATIAKTANITIAVRNVPGTHAATGYDCKRLCKEADSAWIRLGIEPATLDVASDAGALVGRTVMLWSDARHAASADRADAFRAFRGFLALDRSDGEATLEGMRAAVAHRRRFYDG